VFFYGMCVRSFVNNRSKHWDSLLSMILHLGHGVTIIATLGWTAFWLGFILPAFISLGLGAYLFYAQHNFPTATFSDKEGWSYVNAALGSSSYMKMNPVMHWFTGNIGYHHIHHLNARIPFYRLPEVFKAIPALQKAKTTSLMPGEIIRCFRLKWWDPQLGRMIGFRELARVKSPSCEKPPGSAGLFIAMGYRSIQDQGEISPTGGAFTTRRALE
jgi:omega-6 fatty acid desaturase (delta-12 desaturase)